MRISTMEKHVSSVPEMVVQHEFDDEPTYLVNPTTDDTIVKIYAGNYALQLGRLIAAAPELLEALQDVLRLTSHRDYSNEQRINTMRIIKAEVRAAIAKVEVTP